MQAIRGPEDFTAAFDVSHETIERLILYERLLRQWQKAVNLVAPATLDAVWHRHFADSAQLAALAPPGTRSWIDLGAGAGFPGLVVAILLLADASPPRARRGSGPSPRRDEQSSTDDARGLTPSRASREREPVRPRVALIESDTRKCAFLREVARQVAVRVDILSTRAESARISVNKELPRVVSARALAPLRRLLGLAAPLSPSGTTLLLLKGKEVSRELQMAEATWKFDVTLVPSVTDEDGRIAVITNLERKAKD